tara:strand:- start:347 stop:577 length:231 start_codon:yes stop_codon:yes gene_type:complete
MAHQEENTPDFDSHSEYDVEEIDLTEDRMYQILSTMLEDNTGNNICECVNKLNQNFDTHNKLLLQILEKLDAQTTN